MAAKSDAVRGGGRAYMYAKPQRDAEDHKYLAPTG